MASLRSLMLEKCDNPHVHPVGFILGEDAKVRQQGFFGTSSCIPQRSFGTRIFLILLGGLRLNLPTSSVALSSSQAVDLQLLMGALLGPTFLITPIPGDSQPHVSCRRPFGRPRTTASCIMHQPIFCRSQNSRLTLSKDSYMPSCVQDCDTFMAMPSHAPNHLL